MVRLIKPIRVRSSRREQWRLLLLILPLGFVLVLMARLRDPQTADRINRVFTPVELNTEQPPAQAAVSPPGRSLHPGVHRDLLATIEDNTYFRNVEKEAWFHFFEVLQAPPAEPMRAARGVHANYTQLVDQPGYYRGKLVTVYGRVREVTAQTPAANALGIETYYRAVFEPADGVPWPILVYSLELPTGLTVGDDLNANMRASGLFFKNLSYRWDDGLGTAPVILARTITYDGSESEPEVGSTGAEPKTSRENTHATEPVDRASLQAMLALAGWDAERLEKLDDGQPMSDEQRSDAIKLLRRLRSFGLASLEAWSRNMMTGDVMTRPSEYRGQLVQLAGRVKKVTRHALDAADTQRLEMAEYFECRLHLEEDAGMIIVLTARVPRAWLRMKELDEPATTNALYLKRLPNDQPAQSVWLANDIAWHPTSAIEPHVSFGESILGSLGFDVGLLDVVASRGRLRTADAAARGQFNEQRQAFYQLLDAMGEISAEELIRLAQGNLANVLAAWQHELESTSDTARRKLASETVDRAKEGRYSVAPLFNEPERQIGRLLVVDGVARRTVRVEVGMGPDGERPSDVARRFGIDHYYEMEVFTDDSQNYPLVFCVRDLPAGFPMGGSIHVPVRVAGFFFKDWLYRTRGAAASDADGHAQYAPLLVGRAPLVLTVESGGGIVQIVLGGVFVAAVIGIWVAAAHFARGDRQFRASVPAAGFSLPPGQSLNDLNVATADEPMKDSGGVDADTNE